MALVRNNEVFYEDREDDVISENTWVKINNSRIKDGFRDGMEEGQKKTLQDGFNNGYEHGYGVMFAISEYRGILQGLRYFLSRNQRPQAEILKATILKVKELEKQILHEFQSAFAIPVKHMDHLNKELPKTSSRKAGEDITQSSPVARKTDDTDHSLLYLSEETKPFLSPQYERKFCLQKSLVDDISRMMTEIATLLEELGFADLIKK
ncbi:uncharacterized protein LOC106469279 [Limulus polyphemus]|uniref:Uncharacterized protein LOC106469279 n=1 Tax=Limulus polyphemus TaxID=6850 RepID=A0ABM1BMX6_LIMPO|nr:uncharacterized protein LOC106469279 [Limulus polyphemus]